MRGRSLCAALATCLAACASPDLDRTHDVIVSGNVGGDGKTIHVALVEREDGEVLKTLTETVVDSSFHVEFENVLDGTIDDEEPTVLGLDFYVDLDGNSACDTPPIDLAWRFGVFFQEWSEDLEFDRDWSMATQTSAGCASFQ